MLSRTFETTPSRPVLQACLNNCVSTLRGWAASEVKLALDELLGTRRRDAI